MVFKTVELLRVVRGLLAELAGHAKDWPHAATLAVHLDELFNRPPEPQQCVIVWTNVLRRSTVIYSVRLHHGAEMAALSDAHGKELTEFDEPIEVLLAAIKDRGRVMRSRTEGRYMIAKVDVL